MQKQRWYHIIPRNTGLSIYAWIIFCILPFYFVFKNSSPTGIIFGLVMILLFFAVYRLSFLSKGWTVYISVGIEMTISMIMTMFLGYVYFSLFLAFYIGNIERKASFITLYVIHLISTLGAVSIGFFTQTDIFLSQFPFIIISVLGVILLPFTLYNLNKQERLESQLKDANKKISQLMVLEERQRIARDLHDTLGQKLSLIGLKSDLAGKLIYADQDTAKSEIEDIHQTARIALKEVRDMVSDMKEARLDDEILRVKQILHAAQMTCHIDGEMKLKDTPLLIESVLTMCLKEAVTNVVKHSQATSCHITIKQLSKEWLLKIKDNGIGLGKSSNKLKGNGIQGMKERLEFVNGNLDIQASQGLQVTIRIPNVIKEVEGAGVYMIRIVIAEDQQMLLGALASLLNLEKDMEVVGKAKNGEEVLKLVRQHKPDICMMDIEMPVISGLDAAEKLKNQPCKVIVLTTFARTGYFQRAREANVSGYLLKDSPSEELADSIRSIMAGRRIYAPELVDMAFDRGSPLTEREEQVIHLIAEGKNTKKIAELLYITTGTVRNYVSVILDKLEVSNRVEAVSRYEQKGWLRK